jgi:hypothetical protein
VTERLEAEAWDRAIGRYRDIPVPAARFNVELLEALRPRWEGRVRPDTSMFDVLFTRPDATGYSYDEHVEVTRESDDRVRVALTRMVPGPGEAHPAGPVVVTGDFVRPENATTVVESFLMQLAGGERANA